MTDQCKHCIFRGDLKGCQSAECHKHDDWYSVQLNKRIAELESKCELSARCNKELDKTNNELEKDLGLTRLALEQKVNQLLSCESALAERDEKLAELEKELEKKESVILHMLQRDEAHNLEQQAKGVELFIKSEAEKLQKASWFADCKPTLEHLYDVDFGLSDCSSGVKFAERLRNEAAKLKEGE